jgi:hypothetical protein
MTSLEGWGSAIELRPRARRTIPSGEHRQRTRMQGSAPNHYGRRAVHTLRLPARDRGTVPSAPRDAGPRGGRLRNGSTGCGAAWLARLLWEQEAAGSNPAIPTSSEHMLILKGLSLGANWEPCAAVPGMPDRKRRGYGEDSIYFDHFRVP